ncbi:MAG: mechanosensitive ion channel domain-containing protein [Woeseia sp.]
MEQIVPFVTEFINSAVAYLSQSAVYVQLGVIILLFFPAHLLAKRIEPLLEEQARKIKKMPGVLRFVVALLRRLRWLFFVLLLAVAYVATDVIGVPASNNLIYITMVLSGAWLVISLVSQVMRSRALGKAFTIIAWAYVALLVFGVADDVANMLGGTQLFSVGDEPLTLLGLIKGVVFLGVMLWLALTIGNFLDRRVQQIDELTPSLRVLIGKILRIALLVFAILTAMSSLGINLTALTVLSGAVGVGIGFGLQKVVSNFISGIIILLDQSIKPGDTISLGETFGWIRELRARFVSVVTRDGREFLIPNEDFITREVINWSFSDEYVRLDVPFGVSYDADPHEVSRLAIEATGKVDRVDSSRNPPVCWMTEFGDSSVNYLLRFWIRDPQKGLTNIRGIVLLALWDVFKENDIKIPYPHREVIMKTPVQFSQTPLPND